MTSFKNNVKIDSGLLARVNEIIKDSDLKIRYSSAKQFVDIAVLELLNKEKRRLEQKVIK